MNATSHGVGRLSLSRYFGQMPCSSQWSVVKHIYLTSEGKSAHQRPLIVHVFRTLDGQ